MTATGGAGERDICNEFLRGAAPKPHFYPCAVEPNYTFINPDSGQPVDSGHFHERVAICVPKQTHQLFRLHQGSGRVRAEA